MKIEEALQNKKQELEEIERDIASLESKAKGLKDFVKTYRTLKKQSRELKQLKEGKQLQYESIISFFRSVDDNYLNKIYPLFADLKDNPGTEDAA
jgi:uncharacterized coiled-coil DUF342 family protein